MLPMINNKIEIWTTVNVTTYKTNKNCIQIKWNLI